MNISGRLAEILDTKRDHWAQQRRRGDWRLDEAPPPRPFRAALQATAAMGRPAVIAELKKASPSAGLLQPNFLPARHAKAYQDAGASALSVLTDSPFFQGKDADLIAAREACSLPVLRKDFLFDSGQIDQSRALGADCILLIVAVLDDVCLRDFLAHGRQLGMDVLLEVHDAEELERAQRVDADLIGINNRDLRSFKTDLQVSLTLADACAAVADERVLVSESGIRQAADIQLLQAAGCDAFLIGESLMRMPDPGLALADLLAACGDGNGR